MNAADISKLVDEISQTLVLTDPEAVEAFEQLPEKFGDLAAILLEMGQETVSDSCRAALSLSVKTLSGEVDWQKGLEVLARTCDAIQACLNEDCPVDEACFPEELSAGLPAVAPETTEEPPVEPIKSDSPADDNFTRGLVDDSIVSEFLSRQADILSDVEELLLNMQNGGTEEEQAWLLRFFHTLKGESALLGMNDVADLCHAAEDMMQGSPMAECVDNLLEVKDWFIQYFRNVSENGPAPQPLADILALLTETGESSTEIETPAPPVEQAIEKEVEPVVEKAPEPVKAAAVEYEITGYIGQNILEGDVDLLQDFIEEAVEHLDASEVHLLTIESDPQEGEALNAVFRGFHTIKGLAGFIALEHVKDLAHKAENLLDMARRQELELTGNNMDLVFESVDMMKRLVGDVTTAMGGAGVLPEEAGLPGLMSRLLGATEGEAPAAAPEPVAAPKVEEIPEPEIVIEEAEAKPVPKSGFIPLGNMKKKAPAKEPETVIIEEAPAPAPLAAAKADTGSGGGTAPAPSGKAKAPVKMKEAVRVDAERLDHLVETIGELVIAESMVSQSPELKDNTLSVKLAKDLDHLDKICRELQEIGMSLRMVPVRPVFQKMARLVRDLGKKQNRKVDFFMDGEDTELDKNVVDKIGDPLVHMVRNSVDHGIEPDSNDRLKAGKPERGRVELRAFHKGGNICIEIEDDGRGLDRDAILEKAVARGLMREGEKLSDREIYNMIFEAGFSTAQKVTEVSGRGVGMDVVRRNIEELRGTCDISSEKGKGSIFSIKLPLTLAIIEGMVIVVGQEHYIIPTLSVVRLIRPKQEDFTHVFDKGEMLAFEGAHLPLFRIGSLFDVPDAKTVPEDAVVVVVEEEGKKIGLMADHLLGQQSIVIKNLGETVQGTDGVAGGAIMSDGNVALILDIAGLVRVAHNSNMSILPPQAATVDTSVTQGVSEADTEPVVEESAEPEVQIEDQQPVETGV
jgi:two-component system, chemotaxis family, sensor kinase CheA